MLSGIVAQRVRMDRVRLRADAHAAASAADRFRELMDSELDGSYRLAATILRDPTEAEDAVHDAAVLAWRSWHQLRQPDSAPAWFKRILINTCRDRIRQRRRRALLRIVRLGGDDDLAHVPDASEQSAARDLMRRELARLSPDERIAIALRFGDDMTVPAIAEALGIPEGTVKSRLHNAVRKLRSALGDHAS